MDTPQAEEKFRTMTPTTMERRIGGPGSALFEERKGREQLVIEYVNITRIGEKIGEKKRRS